MNPIQKTPKRWQRALNGLIAAYTFFLMPSRIGAAAPPAPKVRLCQAVSTQETATRAPAEEGISSKIILLKMISAYDALHSYQDETRVGVYTKRGRTVPDLEIPFEFKLQRPNQVSMKFLGYSLISNGRALWNYAPKLKQCITEEPPDSLDRMRDVLSKNHITEIANRSIVLSLLMRNDGGARLREAIADSRFIGLDRIGESETYVVDGTDKDGIAVRFWIGKDNFLIYRAFIDYTYAGTEQTENPTARKQFIAETHKYILVNKKLPEATFQPASPRTMAEG